jgi:hypothetical protein
MASLLVSFMRDDTAGRLRCYLPKLTIFNHGGYEFR